MKWKKGVMLLLLLLFVGMFTVSCTTNNDEIDFQGIFDKVVSIGNLDFLGAALGDEPIVGFMRIMIFILVFAILFEVSRLSGLRGNIGGTIAAIVSIMSVMFIPGTVLAAIGGAYATLISFILIGTPVAGGLYLIYVIPSDNRWQIGLKVVLLALLLWILMGVRDQAFLLV